MKKLRDWLYNRAVTLHNKRCEEARLNCLDKATVAMQYGELLKCITLVGIARKWEDKKLC